MAKYKCNGKSSACIRLLILFFIVFNLFLYGENNFPVNIEYTDEPLFIDSYFAVHITLNETLRDYKNKLQFSKLHIEDPCLEFIETETEKLYNGIIIKNKYKLKKAGIFVLKPKLKSGSWIIKLKDFSITVEPPILSAKTEFKWKIFSEKNKQIKAALQGKTYLLVLTGFFYNPNTEKNNHISEILCQAPENSILEVCSINDVPVTPPQDYGWQNLACFYWTPIAVGEQPLPEPNLIIKANDKSPERIIISSETIFVYPAASLQKKENTEALIANESLRHALDSNSVKKNNLNFLNSDFEIIKTKAAKIADLRLKESKQLFTFKIKNNRLNIEKELGIKESFTVYPVFLKKISFILSFFFIFLSCFVVALNKIKKRKLFSFSIVLFIVPALFLFCIHAYLFADSYYQKAVYVPQDTSTVNFIYHIPELSGTAASELKPGETVIIKKKTGLWVYVEKTDKTGGWKLIKDFIIIE